MKYEEIKAFMQEIGDSEGRKLVGERDGRKEKRYKKRVEGYENRSGVMTFTEEPVPPPDYRPELDPYADRDQRRALIVESFMRGRQTHALPELERSIPTYLIWDRALGLEVLGRAGAGGKKARGCRI
ncbi:hypothetical protein VTN00DRAFT_8875 [Thermoascus crustaceus]|uniref:uncharacterized protein n=1 Tax=Thermoascus crustaceus TaxID=5088 RepID=UPI0037444F7C